MESLPEATRSKVDLYKKGVKQPPDMNSRDSHFYKLVDFSLSPLWDVVLLRSRGKVTSSR